MKITVINGANINFIGIREPDIYGKKNYKDLVMMIEKYCKDHNIRHIKNAVRTPRANGQVERANSNILKYLRTTTDIPRHWDEHLNEFQWIINSQANATTGLTPNELIYNFKIKDVAQNHLALAIQGDLVDSMV